MASRVLDAAGIPPVDPGVEAFLARRRSPAGRDPAPALADGGHASRLRSLWRGLRERGLPAHFSLRSEASVDRVAARLRERLVAMGWYVSDGDPDAGGSVHLLSVFGAIRVRAEGPGRVRVELVRGVDVLPRRDRWVARGVPASATVALVGAAAAALGWLGWGVAIPMLVGASFWSLAAGPRIWGAPSHRRAVALLEDARDTLGDLTALPAAENPFRPSGTAP